MENKEEGGCKVEIEVEGERRERRKADRKNERGKRLQTLVYQCVHVDIIL